MNNKKIVDRINGTRHFSGLSYENAILYLKAVFEFNLGLGSEDFVEVKENILYVLKVIMAHELGLELDQISYRIKELNNDTAAQLEDNLGDFKFKISINKNFFNESRINKFIFSLLHEYGHIKQVVDERNGKDVPRAIGIIDNQYESLSNWQKKGVLYKYFANENEMDANNFAYKKMLKFYKTSVKQYGKNRFNNETRDFLLSQYINRNLRFYVGKIKYLGWKCITKALRMQENDATNSEQVSATIADKVFEKNTSAGKDWISKDSIDEVIESIVNTQDYESLPQNSRETILMTLANLKTIKFALDMDMDTDRIGIARVDGFNQPVKFVKTSEKANNSPMFGFFALNTKLMAKIKNISAFEKELEREIKKAKKYFKNDLLEQCEI